MSARRWALLGVLALGLVVTAAVVAAQTAADETSVGAVARTPAASASASPASPTTRAPRDLYDDDGDPLYDRTLKVDLLDRLEEPPELVVLGGSRAMRFEPSFIRRLTGLSAFNFAVRNSHPEDAWAIVSYMLSRAPDTELHVVYPLQTTGFRDTLLHTALLEDERFSRWLPPRLVERQRAVAHHEQAGIPAVNRYSARGCLLYNGYDERLARGVTQTWTLRGYIRRLLPGIEAPSPKQTRSRRYFARFVRLCNEHGVVPAIVVMPYHPAVLEAFRAVGWQKKHDALLAYLRDLRRTYDFRVLDYTDIETFGGDPRFFYDGSHLMTENSRRLLRQAVEDAPACF